MVKILISFHLNNIASIQVKSKVSGKIGTLPQERFDPSKYEQISSQTEGGQQLQPTPTMNPLQKIVSGPALPMAGAIAGGVSGGGLASIPMAGVGMAGGTALQTLLKYATGLKQLPQSGDVGEAKKQSKENLISGGKAFVEGAASEAVGQGISALGSKILGPVLSKIKIGTPQGMQRSLETLKGEYGDEIEELLSKFGSKKLSSTGLIASLEEMKSKPQILVNPEAVSAVQTVIESIKNTKILLEKFGLKVKLGISFNFAQPT